MAETPQAFTLNDFPPEIIEKFVPDERPSTISCLKLVNKWFNEIFSHDYFYKFYLRFPEKHYLCEEKCVINTSGKEVFKDIKSGSVGKWKGYLTLENIHLENWSKGEITHSEIVPLPESSLAPDRFHYYYRWEALIDENSEHWLLNVRNDRAIVLLNITNKPKVLVYPKTDTYAHCHVILLSGQVMFLNVSECRVTVLDIVYDGDVISLQYKLAFDIEEFSRNWIISTGKCESDGSYKHLLVYDQFDDSGVLRFHDLKTGSVLEAICLMDYEFLDSYANVDVGEVCFALTMKAESLSKLESPYIVVRIGDPQYCKALVFFNIDDMQVTTFFDISCQYVNHCYIYYNVAYVFSSNSNTHGSYEVSVHRVSLERSCENMEKPTTPDLLCRFLCNSYFDVVLSKSLKFAVRDYEVSNKVHIMSIKDFEVIDVEVCLDHDIGGDFRIRGVIGPDVLIIENYENGNQNIISYKIPKEGGGQCKKMVDWGIEIATATNRNHCVLPVNLEMVPRLSQLFQVSVILSEST